MASDAAGESQLARDGSFLVISNPIGRADVDYVVPGLSNEARSKLEAARSPHGGQAGRLDGLRSAALGILAACLRRVARRKNSVATA